MQVERNIDLSPFNTFKVKAVADYLVRIQSINDIKQLLTLPVFKDNKHLILGGGSNVVLMSNFNGLVVKSEESRIDVIAETDEKVTIKASSGVIWHDLVLFCLKNDWGGVENLSLIPGTVGAAPIQNIGAYGVEVKDVIDSVEGIDLRDGKVVSLSNNECRFSYRESVFKHELKENIFISSITLTLTKKKHLINYKYDALLKQLLSKNIQTPTIQEIAQSVIEVRQSKLPDPIIIGNAGSFFKNPIISEKHVESLRRDYPLIPIYQAENQQYKVPAGWLIENSGWKGKRVGNVGVHQLQALVIVNHGNATGEEIFELSEKILNDVNEKFGIELTREVNIIR